MCDNQKFALGQFNKQTPYYQNQLDTSFYFSFCQKSDQSPCDGLLCSTTDGKTFNNLGKSLAFQSDTLLAFKNGDCDGSNNGHADIVMLCGDVNFEVLQNDKCYLKAEYQHPYFCPRLQSTCNTNWQNTEFNISPFQLDLDGSKLDFKCVSDFKKDSSNCNDNAICFKGKGLQNPFLRHISTNGLAFRFLDGNENYEVQLNCNNDQNKVMDSYSLFPGGPTVKRISFNNGTCPKQIYGQSIVGYVILAMYIISHLVSCRFC